MPINEKYENEYGKYKKITGFTLLEVMIALVISAVSLLGLASLQAQSLSFNHSAYIRSQATYFAYDILEKMRMNIVSANAGSYDLAIAATPTTATCDGSGVTCTAATLAEADLFTWHNEVINSLPGGITEVSRDTTGQTIVQVLVRWNNLNTSGTSEITVRGEL